MSQERKPEGFDIDLAEMVGKALGVKVELQQVTGANRIPYLLTDKVDLVISVMGLTPERAKQIMFTAPYADTHPGRLRTQECQREVGGGSRHAQGGRRQGHDPGARPRRHEPAREHHAHGGRRDCGHRLCDRPG